MTLLTVLVLGLVLTACGDDNKSEKPNTNEGGNALNDPNVEVDPDFDPLANEYFKKVYDKMEEKGFEVELAGYEPDPMFVDVRENFRMVINKEDILTFEVYDIDPDSEHLATAAETGEFPVEFEGQEGTIPAKVNGHHIFYLAEGHPDFKAIMEAVDEIE